MSKMKMDPVEYRRGEIIFRGWLADDPAGIATRPGVLLVHEAWGLGDYVKHRAERLAEMGYVAFAADMFGQGKQAASTEEGLGWTKALRADVGEMRHECGWLSMCSPPARRWILRESRASAIVLADRPCWNWRAAARPSGE